MAIPWETTVSSSPRVRIGTRGSPLARWQADWVAANLRQLGAETELIVIKTEGDVRSGPIAQIGGQGVFTKEIQRALIDSRVDIAVHSLKDLPTEPVSGLRLGAVPPRAVPSDVLVARSAYTLATLPLGARIGTGSNRRRAQLLHHRPDLVVEPVRGNLETRLRKLDEAQTDALVLAEAGLRRLGLEDRIGFVFPSTVMLPAVGQGAIGVEIRAEDQSTQQTIAPLDDPSSHAAVVAERAALAGLRGGCLAPIGALGHVESGELTLDVVVLSPDGRQRIAASDTAGPDEAEALGQRVADQLLAQGAGALIDSSRKGSSGT
jgi:hydroxymethylbilane synthase